MFKCDEYGQLNIVDQGTRSYLWYGATGTIPYTCLYWHLPTTSNHHEKLKCLLSSRARKASEPQFLLLIHESFPQGDNN